MGSGRRFSRWETKHPSVERRNVARQSQMPPPCHPPMPMPAPAASASASTDAANNPIANANATCVFVLPGAWLCTCRQVLVQVPAPTASANAATAYHPNADASACVSCGYARSSASVTAPASSASAAAANHPNASAEACTAPCSQNVPVDEDLASCWVTRKGWNFHVRRGCSGSFILQTKRNASTMGLTPCRRCSREG